MFNLDDPSSIDVFFGTGLVIIFKAHQKQTDTRRFLVEKTGKYRISVASTFTIKPSPKVSISQHEYLQVLNSAADDSGI
jgi:hypothetical protein